MCVASQFAPLSAQTPTATFTYPSNNATGVPLRPLIKLQTQYRIDTSTIIYDVHDFDSLDTSEPTIILVAKMVSDSFSQDVKYLTIRGDYSFPNDTTIVFQPYQELAPLTTYYAFVGSLNVLIPEYPAGYDTVATSSDTLAFTIANHAYRLVNTSFYNGVIRCGDTLSATFNRKLQSPTSPLDSVLIEFARLDSVVFSNDSTSVQYKTSFPLTFWLDPSDSTILRALPDSALEIGRKYIATVKVGELTGEPADNLAIPLLRKAYYEVKTSIVSADTSYSIPASCVVTPETEYYGIGDSIVITAVADTNHVFIKWIAPDIPEIDGIRIPSITLEAVDDCRYLQDKIITAVFAQIDTITITVTEDTAVYSVAVYDENDSYLGGAGAYSVAPGNIIRTVTTPDSAYQLEEWYIIDNGGDTVKTPSALVNNPTDWGNSGYDYKVGSHYAFPRPPCDETNFCVYIVGGSYETAGPCNPAGDRQGPGGVGGANRDYFRSSAIENPLDVVDIWIDGDKVTSLPACKTKTGATNTYTLSISIKPAFRSCWDFAYYYSSDGKERPITFAANVYDFPPGTTPPSDPAVYTVTCPEDMVLTFHLTPKTKHLEVQTTLQNPGTLSAVGKFIFPRYPGREVFTRVWKKCFEPVGWTEITYDPGDDSGLQKFDLPCGTQCSVKVEWVMPPPYVNNPSVPDWEFAEWICSPKTHPYPPTGPCPPTDPTTPIEFVFTMDQDRDVEAVVKEKFRLAKVGLWEDNLASSASPTWHNVNRLYRQELGGNLHRDLNIIHDPSTKGATLAFEFSHPFWYYSTTNSTINGKVIAQELSDRLDWVNGVSPPQLRYVGNMSNSSDFYRITPKLVYFKLRTYRGTKYDGIPHAEEFTVDILKSITRQSDQSELVRPWTFTFETEMPGLEYRVKSATPLATSDYTFLGLGDPNIELYCVGHLGVTSFEQYSVSGTRVIHSRNPDEIYNTCVNCTECYNSKVPNETETYQDDVGLIVSLPKMHRRDIVESMASAWDYDKSAGECYEAADDWEAVLSASLITAGFLALGTYTAAEIIDVMFSAVVTWGIAFLVLAYLFRGWKEPDLLGINYWGQYNWPAHKFGAKPNLENEMEKTNDIAKTKVEFKLKRTP